MGKIRGENSWGKFAGKIRWEDSRGKFAGKIRGENSRGKFAGKIRGEKSNRFGAAGTTGASPPDSPSKKPFFE
jgi:hypothetical protein